MKPLLKLLQFGALTLLLLTVASAVFPAEALSLAHAVPHGLDLYTVLVAHPAHQVLAVGVCLPIGDIVEDDCGANPGGTVDLFVMRRRDVQTFPAPGSDGVTISEPIVPKPGKGFVKWDFAADTGDINHKSAGDLGNQSISQDLSVYIPRGNAAIDSVINAAVNGDYVVIARDSLGQLRIAGDDKRGVKFDYDYKSGKKGSDKNGSDFKFAGEGFTHVPYYYTAAVPLLGPTV